MGLTDQTLLIHCSAKNISGYTARIKYYCFLCHIIIIIIIIIIIVSLVNAERSNLDLLGGGKRRHSVPFRYTWPPDQEAPQFPSSKSDLQ
jgi:hypothetical protein